MVLNSREYERGTDAFGEVIAVDVGPDKLRGFLHKKLVVSDSDFFKAATHPRWDSADRQSIDLSDEDPDTFGMFSRWLYTRYVVVVLRKDRDTCHASTQSSEEQHLSKLSEDDLKGVDSKLIDAYDFGQRRLAPLFRDAVISALARRVICNSQKMSMKNIGLAFERTNKEDALRRLIIDHHVQLVSTGTRTFLDDCYHHEFVVDLAKALALFISTKGSPNITGDTLSRNTCDYHQHGSQEECSPYFNGLRVNSTTRKLTRMSFDIEEVICGIEKKALHIPREAFKKLNTWGPITTRPSLHFPEISCAAVELLLQRTLLHWRFTDFIRFVCKDPDSNPDFLLEQFVHLHCAGVLNGNTFLHNRILDMIIECAELSGRLPSNKTLEFVHRLLSCKNDHLDGHPPKIFSILAILVARRAEITTFTNVTFLQTIVVVNSSLRDTKSELTSRDRPVADLVAPWEIEATFCKYFHIHREGESTCGEQQSAPPFGQKDEDEQYDCVESFCKRFHERLGRLLSSTAMSGSDSTEDCDDEHRDKRQRLAL